MKTLALIRVAGADGREISVSRWAYLHWFVPFAAPKNASLLYAIANLVLLFALLYGASRAGWLGAIDQGIAMPLIGVLALAALTPAMLPLPPVVVAAAAALLSRNAR